MKWLALLIVMLMCGVASGTPSVSGVSGTVADGESVVVSGSGFETHSLDIEWLGGSGGNIEQGVNGALFSKTGWTNWADSDVTYAVRYSSEDVYSGSKSIKSSFDASHYNSGFSYDNGGDYSKIYATWWTKFIPSGFQGQWKIWRIMPVNNVHDSYSPQFYGNAWNAIDFANTNTGVACRPYDPLNSTVRWYSTTGDDNKNELGYGQDWPGENMWSRVEVYAKASTLGIRDGSFVLTTHRDDAGINTNVKANYVDNLMTYADPQTDAYRYWTFQNFIGNAYAGHERDGEERIFHDDIYIQIGNRARVEIGNNSAWSSCTHREIQIPTAWSTSSITIDVNSGSFGDSETAYLFVVDDDGAVSGGYEITFGSGFAPDHTKPYYNVSSQIVNTVNSTGYNLYDREPTANDDEITSFKLVVTTS